MTSDSQELLDAVIGELESLKRTGSRFVSLSPEGAEALASMTGEKRPQPARTTSVQRPASPNRAVPTAGFTSPSSPVVTPALPMVPVAPPESSILPAMTREEKEAAIAALKAQVLACVKCPHLAKSRKNVVFGVGDIHSPLMFVGEAPGADEDEQGEPFVGRAGQLLTKIIQAMGFSRETVFIANILKCRPDTPGETSGNRPPTPDEIATCLPYLNTQIDLIRPKAIVALGATSVAGLFGGKQEGITKLRGKWMTFRGIAVMPTLHPSYLLRPNGAAAKPLVWQDMLSVMDRLGLPITEKQRGFFRNGTTGG